MSGFTAALPGSSSGDGESRLVESYEEHPGDKYVSDEEVTALPSEWPSQVKHNEYHYQGDAEIPECGPEETPLAARGWTPFYLKRSTLAAFVLAQAVILAGLVILQALDHRYDGLATSDVSKHYFWTYGPTAVLALLAALWGQVEYRSRQMAPWRLLAQRPTPAPQTLLLDHVSPSQIVVLLRSCRMGHGSVAVAITCSLLIKLLTLLSTGLLTLESVNQAYPADLLAVERFAATAWDQDFYLGGRGIPLTTLVVAIETYNVSAPTGTWESFAIPTLQLANSTAGNLAGAAVVEASTDDSATTTVEATVSTFSYELVCEAATLSVLAASNAQCQITNTSDAFTASNCIEFSTVHLESPSCSVADASWFYTLERVGEGDTFFGRTASFPCTNLPMGSPNRTLIATGLVGAETEGGWYIPSLKRYTALLCEPRYGVLPLKSKLDTQGNVISLTPPEAGHDYQQQQVGDISADDFQARVQFQIDDNSFQLQSTVVALNSTGGLPVSFDMTYHNAQYSVQFHEFFYFVSAVVQPDTLDFWLDQDALLQQSQRLYGLVAAQLAKRALLAPNAASDAINGTVDAVENRLRVRGLSLNWMFATLSLLIVLTSVMVLINSGPLVSRDPGSIGGLATIIARSHNLARAVQCPGGSAPSEKQLQRSLAGHYCVSTTETTEQGTSFKLDLYESGLADHKVNAGPDPDPEMTREEIMWWRPWSLRTRTKILVVVFLLVLLATLEILYQESLLHEGLAFVETNEFVKYTWQYIPALVMLIAQQLADAINYTTHIQSPYYELRRGPSSAENTLFHPGLGRLTIQSFLDSLRRRRWGLLATSTAMLLAPFLAIVASGLYSVGPVKVLQPADVKYASVFNSTAGVLTRAATLDYHPELSEAAGVVSGMLYQENIRYPAWTLGRLALVEVIATDARAIAGGPDAAALDQEEGSPAEYLTVRLPALRASADCRPVPTASLNITTEDMGSSTIGWATWPNSRESMPADCGNVTRVSFPWNATDPVAYMAWGADLECSDLPWSVAVYGQLEDAATGAGLHFLNCTIPVEMVQADAVLSLPDHAVVAASVAPDEEASAVYLYDVAGGDFGSLWASTSGSVPGDGDTVSIKGAFSLAFALGLLTVDDLVAADALDKINAAFTNVTGTLWAQYANLGGRVPYDDDAANSYWTKEAALNGTLQYPDRLRLQQGGVSTRILEALLGAMVLCLALSVAWSARAREVLPVNPCSIAGAASLLAGSDMLKGVPPGAELHHGGPGGVAGRPGGVFAHGLFSMGWWWCRGDGDSRSPGSGGGGATRFGIDVGRAAWDKSEVSSNTWR